MVCHADSDREDPGHDSHELESAIEAQTRRRIRSLSGEQRGVLFWVGMFGLVGWSVALPTLLGTALGVYLDKHWPSSYSWTLTLLFAGLVFGCLTAWRWMHTESQESASDLKIKPGTKDEER